MGYVYIYIYIYIGGYVNKAGVAVVFGAEERQSETSVLGERLYLVTECSNCIHYVTDD